MEYAATLEEKTSTQAELIVEIEASVYGQTVLTKNADNSASAVSTGASKELTEIRAMMKQLAYLVVAQATTVATLSIKMNNGGGGGGWDTYKKK